MGNEKQEAYLAPAVQRNFANVRVVAVRIRIEAPSVAVTLDVRTKGWRALPRNEGVPIDIAKPTVSFDVGHTVGAAKAGLAIDAEKPFDEVLGFGVELTRKFKVTSEHAAIGAARIGVAKGWGPSEQFVHKNAESPKIDSFAVAEIGEDFGRDVVWRAAGRAGAMGHDLGESEVEEFGVAITIEPHRLGFEVAVYDVERVQIFDGAENLGRVKEGMRRSHREEVATSEKLEEQIDVKLVVEVAVEPHDERVRRELQDSHLALELFELCHDAPLRHELQREIGVLPSHETHAPERPLAQSLTHLKVGYSHTPSVLGPSKD